MQPPIIRLIQTEQYPEAPDWFGRFLTSLNRIIQPVHDGLTNNITLSQNIPNVQGVVTVLANTDPTQNTLTISTDLNRDVKTVQINTWLTTDPTNPVLGFDYHWYKGTGTVTVNAMQFPTAFIGKNMQVNYLVLYSN